MTHMLKSHKELKIREAIIEDSESIIAYLKNIIIESDNLTFERGEFNPTIETEKQFIKDINQSSSQCFFVSLIGTKIVGNLSIIITNRIRLKHSGDLSITVSKEYWNQGIGSSLMIEFIQWLDKTDLTKINLKVREDNIHAIKLYEKFGFIKEGVITRDFYIDGQYYNSICMGKLVG